MTAKRTPNDAQPGGRRRVLIVDDEEPVRAALLAALDAAGDFLVEVAPDGASGLRLFAAAKPDVLFLDLVLPDIGGLEFLRTIAGPDGSGARPSRIVLMTALRDPFPIGKLADFGADALLPKPFGLDDIKRLLENYSAETDIGGGFKPTIWALVVDDDVSIREGIAENLQEFAMTEITLAENGDEALALITVSAPDVMFLDLMMPVKDGFEVLKAVRGRPIEKRPRRIVMMSAIMDAATAEQLLKLGADVCMPKPFTQMELRAALGPV